MIPQTRERSLVRRCVQPDSFDREPSVAFARAPGPGGSRSRLEAFECAHLVVGMYELERVAADGLARRAAGPDRFPSPTEDSERDHVADAG